MREVLMTALFKSDLDSLDNSIRKRVSNTLRWIESDPYHPGLDSHGQASINGRKIMRSRVNENFRILWEWVDGGKVLLWRIGSHTMIDSIDFIPREPREQWRIFTRDETDQSAVELDSLAVSRDLPQPFAHVPANILRLFGVPDEQLESVKSITDAEEIWDLAIPENVQMTLLDVLTNPNWTVERLLDPNQLRYRATVDQLEGYCEGRIKQLLLNLSEEQRRLVTINARGPLLIKGVAGSGKTTIGLYRANHLATRIEASRRFFGENAAILLLTYTKTLTKALHQLYSELYGELPQSLTVQAYKQWMLDQLNQRGVRLAAATWQQRKAIIADSQEQTARARPEDRVVQSFSHDYLLAEIDDVIRARNLGDLQAYQAINRVGRGIGLDRMRHRPIVWEIYERYQREIDSRNLFDWADLARLVQKHCSPLPQYDVVIIDEAQDLPPSDLRLATRLIPNYDERRSLTLLADPAQSIYYRGISWKEAEIQVQGRTRALAKNFRNSQQILSASKAIVDRCEDISSENEYIPPTSASRLGPKPIVARYSTIDDSNRYVAEEIIRLCQSGKYRPGDIALLARNSNFLTKRVEKALRRSNIHCRFFRDADFHILENEVKLVTMHSAKGLEFPVVFIVGLDDQYVPRADSASATPHEDELQERKLFYVSMTRAAERLYLLHPQRNRSRFLYDLDESTTRQVIC